MVIERKKVLVETPDHWKIALYKYTSATLSTSTSATHSKRESNAHDTSPSAAHSKRESNAHGTSTSATHSKRESNVHGTSTSTVHSKRESNVHGTSISATLNTAGERGTAAKHKYPVLLLHGIASNHRVWDFGIPEFSFAHYLVQNGYLVYSLDLRGRAGSDGPHTGRGNKWSVDDYLLCDLPTACEYILEDSGAQKLHWVGHSMGGILGFFYQIRHKAANLQSFTTFASALNYTYSTINHFRTWLDYMSALQYFPIKEFWSPMQPFAGLNTVWNRFLWNPENMREDIGKKIIGEMIEPIAVNEWNQIKLISAAEGMPRLSGGFPHLASDRRIQVPVLMLAGDRDWLCALDGVEWTMDELSCEKKLMVFGKEYGSKSHYGHMDLVCGITAPREVWPKALTWIDRFDRV